MREIPFTHRDASPGDSRPDHQVVGREAELDRVRTFVAHAQTDGTALIVTGEPGVGKTEILTAASEAASASGTRILRASGVEFEAGMSFSGLNQLLVPLLSELSMLPDLQRNALNVALGFGDGAPPSRLVVSNAAVMLLRQAAMTGPVLVIIDDLPWMDRASAGVLSFIARRLEGSPVGFLGAARSDEENFFDHTRLPELELQRLDADAARRLLDTRWPELGSIARERILVEAQGNPLALLELPVALGPGKRAASEELPSALPLGPRLQALFGRRITDLPPATRQILLLMALDGTGDARVLEGMGPNVGFRDFALAEHVRLAYLDEATHRLAFHHPLIRSTVVGMSQAEERRTAHRALADVWADQPDRRAFHLAEATVKPDESVAAQLEAAAGRILARGDAVGCVKALTRSSELSPLRADRSRRLAAAAYVGAEVAGDLGNASQVLAESRRRDAGVEGSLQAAIAASAFLLQADGDVTTAHRLLVGALESRQGPQDASDPVLAEALHSLMMVCTYGGEEPLWRPFEDAMARAVSIPVTLDLNSRIFVDPAHSEASAVEALDVAIAALADEPDSAQIIRIGMSASYVDRLEALRTPLWRVVHDARRGGAVASGITAMVELARDDVESGEWDEAEELVAEAIAVCEVHGYRAVIWPCRYVQAVIAAARGDEQRAEELVDAMIGWTAPRGIRGGQRFASQVRGLAALGRGDFNEAYRQATSISPPGVLVPHVPLALRVIVDLVEAAVRTGRDAEAQAHVAMLREANVAALSSRLAMVVGTAAALAAPDETASGLFREALALPGIERWQFDLARLRLTYGEFLRRHREMAEARVQLSAALAAFDHLRARPWADRASAELRASGLTKPRAGDSVLDRLTPQEFEIATLAASGMTNKQIAERLYLSHRTVGGHLHGAFPKLGVATRAGLRDALDTLPAEQLPRD